MSITFQPEYPPAQGLYNPRYLPETLDSDLQQTKYFTFEAAAMNKLRELLPPAAYKPPSWLANGVNFTTKEQVVEKLMQHDYYSRVTPADLDKALGMNPYDLPHEYNNKPCTIWCFRFAVDRFKQEPGKLDDIAKRWAEELHWRHAREERVRVIWDHQLNLLQNRFKSFWHQNRKPVASSPTTQVWVKRAPGWKQLSDALFLDFEITHGMGSVMSVIDTLERSAAADHKNKLEHEKSEALAAQRNKEREDRMAKEAADKQKQQDDLKALAEQRKKEEEEAEAKREQDKQARESTLMNSQAKLAAYQAAIAALSADLQAGKITGAEYGAQIVALSSMLQ